MSMIATTPEPKPLPVQQMDGAEHNQLEPQPYHCCSEWHLARLGGICTVLHPFALHLSHRTKKFCCSAVSLGPFFDCNESTIRRGFEKLENAGFFEKVRQGTFAPSSYRVLNHDEWAAEHPNQCPEKFDYGWAQDEDPLGPRLWIASDGAVKFMPFQLKEMRNRIALDDDIVTAFGSYYESEGHRKQRGNVAKGFLFHLKRVAGSTVQAVQL
jgi:hypothetical protein